MGAHTTEESVYRYPSSQLVPANPHAYLAISRFGGPSGPNAVPQFRLLDGSRRRMNPFLARPISYVSSPPPIFLPAHGRRLDVEGAPRQKKIRLFHSISPDFLPRSFRSTCSADTHFCLRWKTRHFSSFFLNIPPKHASRQRCSLSSLLKRAPKARLSMLCPDRLSRAAHRRTTEPSRTLPTVRVHPQGHGKPTGANDRQ